MNLCNTYCLVLTLCRGSNRRSYVKSWTTGDNPFYYWPRGQSTQPTRNLPPWSYVPPPLPCIAQNSSLVLTRPVRCTCRDESRVCETSIKFHPLQSTSIPRYKFEQRIWCRLKYRLYIWDMSAANPDSDYYFWGCRAEIALYHWLAFPSQDLQGNTSLKVYSGWHQHL